MRWSIWFDWHLSTNGLCSGSVRSIRALGIRWCIPLCEETLPNLHLMRPDRRHDLKWKEHLKLILSEVEERVCPCVCVCESDTTNEWRHVNEMGRYRSNRLIIDTSLGDIEDRVHRLAVTSSHLAPAKWANQWIIDYRLLGFGYTKSIYTGTFSILQAKSIKSPLCNCKQWTPTHWQTKWSTKWDVLHWVLSG